MDSEIPFSHGSLIVAVAIPVELVEGVQGMGAVVGAIDLNPVMRAI